MLQVIQHSFLDVGAVQCGFCTPGMVMATKALLLHYPAPTEPEICDGLKNNYCRCTGYVKIIEAVKLAAARLRGEDPDIDSFRSHESTVIVVGENQVVPEITGFRGRQVGLGCGRHGQDRRQTEILRRPHRGGHRRGYPAARCICLGAGAARKDQRGGTTPPPNRRKVWCAS